LLWFVAELAPGDADDGPACCRQELITLPVLLERGDGAMHPATVSFDDQAGIAPEKVRHERKAIDDQVTVHLRVSKPGPTAEPKKPRLELSFRELFAWIVKGNFLPQSPDSTATPAPGQ
jgi:hypothetical protein